MLTKAQFTGIRIFRYQDSYGSYRKLSFFVDGKLAGRIPVHELHTDFSLKAGKHKIYVKQDWCQSYPMLVNVVENKMIAFKINVTPNYISDMIFKSKSFFKLTPTAAAEYIL